MEPHGGGAATTDGGNDVPSPAITPVIYGEATLQMNVVLPERTNKQDRVCCIGTGHCRFGTACEFNRPSSKLAVAAIAAARTKGNDPERVGQPTYQYLMQTGICKIWSHLQVRSPKYRTGIAGHVHLNTFGYLLRSEENGQPECQYYILILRRLTPPYCVLSLLGFSSLPPDELTGFVGSLEWQHRR